MVSLEFMIIHVPNKDQKNCSRQVLNQSKNFALMKLITFQRVKKIYTTRPRFGIKKEQDICFFMVDL